ncbi:MAG TPA: thioredoxin domain-containing protein [Gemmatimonadaceae bacterium]|jgi:protein-disulfide isomerase|nr:thioredoxin domain-containing protein [Gemmatimonadaceae bacterium]
MTFARLAMIAVGATLFGAARCPSDVARSSRAGAGASADRSAPAVRDTVLERKADHARIEGSDSAGVWVVEISDFQCPFCKEWHDETYATLKRDYVDTGKIRFAYINFPLPGHRNAWPAAEAAMCVAAQGKFWPMHDALFATQKSWETLSDPAAYLDSLAVHVGADSVAYHGCVSKHEMRALIQADIDRATASGVNSTPSFNIGGEMIAGAQPTAVFQQAIDSALARHGAGAAR